MLTGSSTQPKDSETGFICIVVLQLCTIAIWIIRHDNKVMLLPCITYIENGYISPSKHFDKVSWYYRGVRTAICRGIFSVTFMYRTGQKLKFLSQ